MKTLNDQNMIEFMIRDADTIIIHRHVNPDLDALGSQLGLRDILRKKFPDKTVLAVGETTPALAFLGQMDPVEASMYADALVIVLDTGNAGRIDGAHALTGRRTVKIDHHPDRDRYAMKQFVDDSASSTAEIIVRLVEAWGYPLYHRSAYLLYAGIVGDTGRFQFPNTTPRTLIAAARLLSYDIDTEGLYRALNETTLEKLSLQGFILQHVKTYPKSVAYAYVSREVIDRFGLTPEEAAVYVNSFSGLKDMYCWVLFIEVGPEEIRARIRSNGPAIHEVAAKYGGGGHPRASGATVRSWEEAQSLI